MRVWQRKRGLYGVGWELGLGGRLGCGFMWVVVEVRLIICGGQTGHEERYVPEHAEDARGG